MQGMHCMQQLCPPAAPQHRGTSCALSGSAGMSLAPCFLTCIQRAPCAGLFIHQRQRSLQIHALITHWADRQAHVCPSGQSSPVGAALLYVHRHCRAPSCRWPTRLHMHACTYAARIIASPNCVVDTGTRIVSPAAVPWPSSTMRTQVLGAPTKQQVPSACRRRAWRPGPTLNGLQPGAPIQRTEAVLALPAYCVRACRHWPAMAGLSACSRRGAAG